jgi:hypothetical protein
LVPTDDGATAYFELSEGPRVSNIPGGGSDELDAAILDYLRANPGTPKGAIAARIHRQRDTVLNRVKALETAGRIAVLQGQGRTGRAELCEVCE